MIPATAERVLISGGTRQATPVRFRISEQDQAHVMRILRSQIYSNKPRAVIREYATNAWDAHRQAGVERPILVVLPTEIDPHLTIRDWGAGIAPDDMEAVFIAYGASTKRDSNTAAGLLGIGAKSGHAYNDHFSICSWYGGFRRTYLAVLDESDIGVLKLVSESPCDGETGVEIRVPVYPKDHAVFCREAETLLPFFHPVPETNIVLPDFGIDRRRAGFVTHAKDNRIPNWLAVMGPVPYTLKSHEIREELTAAGLSLFVDKVKGGLFFDIGAVDHTASREDLDYTPKTKAALLKGFRELLDELLDGTEAIATDPSLSGWQRRLKIRQLAEFFGGAPLPETYRPLGLPAVRLYTGRDLQNGTNEVLVDKRGRPLVDAPNSFRLMAAVKSKGERRVMQPNVQVPVDPAACILVHDTQNAAAGYVENAELERVAVPRGGNTPAQVQAELAEWLLKAGIDGIPVDLTSDRDWNAGKTFASRKKIPGVWFQWNGTDISSRGRGGRRRSRWDSTKQAPPSAAWTACEAPSDGEPLIFVVLDGFIPTSLGEGVTFHSAQRAVAQFGGVFPPIYGIRNTAKKQVFEKDVPGIPYTTWLKWYLRGLVESKPEAALQLRGVAWQNTDVHNIADSACRALAVGLPADHLVARIFADYNLCMDAQPVNDHQARDRVRWVSYLIGQEEPLQAERREMFLRYPLLRYLQHETIRDNDCDHWLAYIRGVDSKEKNECKEESPKTGP